MLDVVIVGAGIAGLSSGLSLRRAGHRVRILERSALNNEVGAAINVPPNASRVLLAWGLDPDAARFVQVQGISMNAGSTLEQQSYTRFGNWVTDVYAAPFYFAHRVDLHEALKALATGEGPGSPVEIRLRAEVASYDPAAPSVTLSGGEVIKADVVIAADGIHSIALETVLGHPNPPVPQELYNGCFRFLIPAADIDANPEARFWNEDFHGKMRIYTNGEKGNRLISYPCRNNEVHNFVGMFYSDDMASATKEDWLAPADKSHILEAFPDFHPKLRAVLNTATEVKRFPLLYREPISTWVKGKMALAGDSAHPMLPHQGQGGAQGVEDGIALGIALCGATPEQVGGRLKAYETMRKNRASAIQILSNAGQDQVAMVHKQVAKYSKFVPKNPTQFAHFNWGHDLIRDCEKKAKLADPAFKLPPNFFDQDPYMPDSDLHA